MLFFLISEFQNIKHIVVNDVNSNLTDAYLVVRQSPCELIKELKHIENEYIALKFEASRKDYYLARRAQFNSKKQSRVENTALLLFLNRTCFNGLYRENAKGQFNVPFGRYVNPQICNEFLIMADSEALNRCELTVLTGDFERVGEMVDPDALNFIYFDPPYRPLSSTSSFNAYVKEAFNDDSQRRLAQFFRSLDVRGNCQLMLSNADCSAKNPSDTFFENLYQGYRIQRVTASRSVNAVASKRGKITELLITNY